MPSFQRTLLLALALAAAQPLAAQQTGTIEIGAFGHFTKLDEDLLLGGSSFGAGGRVGLFAMRYLAIEGEYGFGTVDDNVRNVSSWAPFRALAVLNIPVTPRIKLLAGGGYKFDTWVDDSSGNQYEEGFSVLGGLRICLANRWSVRPEFVFDHNPSPNLNTIITSETSHFGFRIGLSGFFGPGSALCPGAPPPAAPAPPPAAQPAAPPPQPQAPPPQPQPQPAPPPVQQAPPPAPAPAPAPAPPREIFRLNGVFFDFDSATLTPEGQTQLNQAVTVLNQIPAVRVEIQGHTDSMGTDEYNQDLSLRRANSVREYLVSRGIAAARLTARGFGETQPTADNATEAGRAQNRRVSLIEITN